VKGTKTVASRRADAPRAGPPRPFGVLLQIAYQGTHFRGWASQREGRTVHAEVAAAVRAVDPRAGPPRGTSRTDAGVHAECQIASLDVTLDIPPRGWVLAVNQHLPDDVSVRRAWRIPPGLHPSSIVRSKRYAYRVLLDRVRDPLWKDRAWRIGWPLDLAKAEREAARLVGTHDFGAFRSSHDARKDTVRSLTKVEFSRTPEGSDARIFTLTVEGNAFLYNMVRIIAGTLLDVARGKLEEGTVARALDSLDRKHLGATAPAHGLCLEHVELELPPEGSAPWPP
jgi:tRNA pseudouridine38-40 synthase